MAVEIRELVIKAIIIKDEDDKSSSAAASAVLINTQQVVQECVSQVLKIIRQSQNR